MTYKISDRGIQFLKDNEESGKFKPEAYLDMKGIPTIGYGTTFICGEPVELGMVINEKVALALFMGEINKIIKGISRVVRPTLYQNQIDALISLIYNIGLGGFYESTILKHIYDGKTVTQDLFTRWQNVTINDKLVPVKGLFDRRVREYKLFIEN
jgi:lysozyme